MADWAPTVRLISEHGVLVVLAGLVVTAVWVGLGLAVYYARQRLLAELEVQRQHLEDERAEREQERAERRAMFLRLMGDGNGRQGELSMLRQDVDRRVRDLAGSLQKVTGRIDKALVDLETKVDECTRRVIDLGQGMALLPCRMEKREALLCSCAMAPEETEGKVDHA